MWDWTCVVLSEGPRESVSTSDVGRAARGRDYGGDPGLLEPWEWTLGEQQKKQHWPLKESNSPAGPCEVRMALASSEAWEFINKSLVRKKTRPPERGVEVERRREGGREGVRFEEK